ncbi:MAG: hypothetical protein NC181_00445 [Clostridium sp.]|nr:hypothetical protein [Clostridium sp.]MCM1443866.1 hypothetical protein [Candidatus Amulumruptor caecigallinarius]
MNVIISNNQREKINSLNIEVIKRLDGVFEVDEIISSFQNMFYNRMILDITALKDATDVNVFQKLSISLDMSKLILLLEPGTPMTLPPFLSKLISVGIYNFTTTSEGLFYLYNNPNTYRDVAQYHNIVAQEVQQAATPIQSKPQLVDNTNEVNDIIANSLKIIGLKSITPNAGATSLAIMMKKCLDKNLDALCVEVDKSDFKHFREKDLVSTTSADLINVIKQNSDKNVIIVDLNNSTTAPSLCSDILYLIEPSTIKLNKLVTLKPVVLKELKGKKVVLNKSSLNEKDIKDFSYEANLDVFYNLPALDERKVNEEVISLLNKLNIM